VGCQLPNSDIDIMFVLKDVNVYEEINSTHIKSSETCVAMEMDDTKLGFSHLRLLRCNNNTLFKMRKQVEKDLYLTSQLCKSMFI
jgi:hypothetical protein